MESEKHTLAHELGHAIGQLKDPHNPGVVAFVNEVSELQDDTTTAAKDLLAQPFSLQFWNILNCKHFMSVLETENEPGEYAIFPSYDGDWSILNVPVDSETSGCKSDINSSECLKYPHLGIFIDKEHDHSILSKYFNKDKSAPDMRGKIGVPWSLFLSVDQDVKNCPSEHFNGYCTESIYFPYEQYNSSGIIFKYYSNGAHVVLTPSRFGIMLYSPYIDQRLLSCGRTYDRVEAFMMLKRMRELINGEGYVDNVTIAQEVNDYYKNYRGDNLGMSCFHTPQGTPVPPVNAKEAYKCD